MDAMLGAKPGNPLHHGGAGDSAVKEKIKNARIDRDVVVLGSIAQEERDFSGLARGQHVFSLRSARVPRFTRLARAELPLPGEQRTIEAPLWATCNSGPVV